MSATVLVIPDAIEPYSGWKALRIRTNGRLESPQQNTIWPPKQRLVARCDRATDWSWQPLRGTPREPRLGEPPAGMQMMVSATTMMLATLPDKPRTALPPGFSWSWEPTPHEPAEQGCGCGIYVVADPRGCSSYLRNDCLLAEVALWGKLVPGSQGARGQYAYPQKLFCLEHLADVAELVAEYYGVPLEVREFDSLPNHDRLTRPITPPQLSSSSTALTLSTPQLTAVTGSHSFTIPAAETVSLALAPQPKIPETLPPHPRELEVQRVIVTTICLALLSMIVIAAGQTSGFVAALFAGLTAIVGAMIAVFWLHTR